MRRNVLILMLTVPMLLPPGVCVCRSACAHVPSSTENISPPDDCDCHHDESSDDVSKDRRAGTDLSDPDPTHNDHAPSCPAIQQPVPLDRAAKALGEDFLATNIVAFDCIAVDVLNPSPVVSATEPPGRPLFLTLLTLRI